MQETGDRLVPWVGKILWKKAWQPAPEFLPGESHGQRSLEGYSPCGHLFKDPVSKYSHILRSWELEFQYMDLKGGDTIQLMTGRALEGLVGPEREFGLYSKLM